MKNLIISLLGGNKSPKKMKEKLKKALKAVQESEKIIHKQACFRCQTTGKMKAIGQVPKDYSLAIISAENILSELIGE